MSSGSASAASAWAGQTGDVLAEGRPGEQQRRGRESGLHHGFFVGEVEQQHVVGQFGDRRPGDPGDRDLPNIGRQRPEGVDDLGRGAGTGDRDDGVVVPLAARFRRVRRIRRSEAGGLPELGEGVGEEGRRAAADDQDAIAR